MLMVDRTTPPHIALQAKAKAPLMPQPEAAAAQADA